MRSSSAVRADRAGIDTYGFGLLLTAEATGGLLGAGIAPSRGRRLGTGTALTCTAAVEGLAILGLAAAPNPYMAGLALAVRGAGMGATMVLAPSLRQANVPTHLMGRVASTSRMPAMCAAPPSEPSSAAGSPLPPRSRPRRLARHRPRRVPCEAPPCGVCAPSPYRLTDRIPASSYRSPAASGSSASIRARSPFVRSMSTAVAFCSR